MSFKYRFILSFVLLEVFFITLIVSINFIAISSSSEKLINDSINSKVALYEELIKVPLSIYDLATLDNILDKAQEHHIVNSIIILDNQDTVLSKKFNFDDMSEEDLLKIKKDTTFYYEDEIYEIRYLNIVEDN